MSRHDTDTTEAATTTVTMYVPADWDRLARRALANRLGGCTQVDGCTGAWKAPDGDVMEGDVTMLRAAATDMSDTYDTPKAAAESVAELVMRLSGWQEVLFECQASTAVTVAREGNES